MPSITHNAINASAAIPVGLPVFTLGTTKPDATNTGAGVLRAYPTTVINGNVTLSDGQNLLDTVVNGRLSCAGNNLVENCVVNNVSDGTSSPGAHVNCNHPNVTIRFCTLTMPEGHTFFPSQMVVGIPALLERNNMERACDGLNFGTGYADGKVYGNYIHDLTSSYPDSGHGANVDPGQTYLTLRNGTVYNGPGAGQSSSHSDCIQFENDNSNIEVFGNFLSMNYSEETGTSPHMTAQIQLSCFMMNDGTDLNIHHNWLDGNQNMPGGVAFGVNNGSTVTTGTFANNLFGRGWGQEVDGTLDTVIRKATNGVTYSNNVYESVGDALDGQAVYLRNG